MRAMAGRIATALIASAACAVAGAGQSITVAEHGQARAQIVVSENASPPVRHAAEELQRFLGEISGAKFELVTDTAPAAAPAILVGDSARLRALNLGIDVSKLGMEEYLLRSAGPNFIIAGGAPRGTLYGVYGLLEDYFGCHWYTADVSAIPKRARLELPGLDLRHKPIFEYREPFVFEARDADWCARNRMNSSAAHLDEGHGGSVDYYGFVHTFNALVPPDKYFATHPEYFSLVNGKRTVENAQLCCTNEDVIRIITEEIRKAMREHPEAEVFSISQNDCFNQCQCDSCQAIAKREEAQIAPVLALVNRVADAVRGEFPNQIIDTLAYQWTRKPPKTMRPAPNVVVRLCSIECCFSHSFAACDNEANKAFVKDMEDWAKICNRLWVWDYTTSFADYLVPFPNLRSRAPDIQFFAAHNVTGLFQEDVYNTAAGEFSELSAYLSAKLLWDPEYDPNKAIDDFLKAVYGKAARPLRKYLDLLHDHVEKKNAHVMIWVIPESKYLDDELLAQADRLFDRAEAAVARDAAALARVQAARMSIDHTILERGQKQGAPAFVIDQAALSVEEQPEYCKRAARFLQSAERNKLERIAEGSKPIEAYRKLYAGLGKKQQFTLRPAEAGDSLEAGLHYEYFRGEWKDLPDFAALQPAARGIAANINLEVLPTEGPAALRFTGALRVPADGIYSFSILSNDGSRISIGDTMVADNGGNHGERTKTGFIALAKGAHPLTVTWFDMGGGKALEVEWSGPGFGQQALPPRALFHK